MARVEGGGAGVPEVAGRLMEQVSTTMPRRSRRGWRWAAQCAGLAALCGALVLGLGSLLHIATYGFGELYSDQFRQYRMIDQAGMPAGLFLPDNGHRQVLPNLVRWIDLHWGLGDQEVPRWSGWLAILVCWVMLLGLSWEERRRSPGLAGAVALLVTIGLFWAGSARVQYHGNEALQVHLVILLMLVAITAIAAPRMRPLPAWALGLGCAMLAMLTFATGVAVFAGLIALAVVLRRPWKEVLAGVAVAATCVAAYTFVLPGGDGVRNTISLQPLALLHASATWIAALPITGWLALPVEGAFGAGPEHVADTGVIGAQMAASAGVLRAALGWESQLEAAPWFGSLGYLVLTIFAVRCWLAPQRAGRIERTGLGIALFASALSGLVALGRLEYFQAHPDQMLADRFALYSTLFWSGLLLCLVARWGESRKAVLACLVALAMLASIAPTQELGRGWAEHSARVMEARAAQAQSGVLLEGWPGFADLPDLDAVRDSLGFYLDTERALYRFPRSRMLAQPLPQQQLAEADARLALPVQLLSARPVDAPGAPADAPAWHVEGVVAARHGPDEGVLAVDSSGRVVGLGEFGFDLRPRRGARIAAVGLGFDLYLRGDWQACGPMRLYLASADMSRLQRLQPAGC